MKLQLSKDFNFEGKTYKEIDLDLDGLKGSDIKEISRQFNGGGNFAAVKATDENYQILVAQQASSMPIEFFDELPASDFMQICMAVQNFLLTPASVKMTPTGTSDKPASSSVEKPAQA